MTSAAESELGALYINSGEAVPLRHLVEKMVHPQPPTTIKLTTPHHLESSNIQSNQKKTKAMDVRFH